MTTRISIALATYNGEKYLAEQLQSFCTQTRLPDELIVCDDCSTDGTMQVIYDFQKQAPFSVKIFHNSENLGYIQNFSKALSLCSGDIVFLSDQDDVWLSIKIEKMTQYFELNPDLQLLIHDLDYCKEDLTPIGQTKIERVANFFDLNRDFVVGMATAIREPFLKLCLPIPKETKITHDMWLHQCAYVVQKKAIIREVLALYRRHYINVTTKDRLNVDFVTKPNHFKNSLLKKLRNINNLKTLLDASLDQYLVHWLQGKSELLVENKYISKIDLEHIIEKEFNILHNIKNRRHILSLPRLERIAQIYNMYQRGGYGHFKGLRTAIGDLLPK